MTKKFTQRKRTVRRVSDSREPSPSLPSPAASSPTSSPTIGWSRSGRDPVESLRSQVSTTPKPQSNSKSNSVFRALSKPFSRHSPPTPLTSSSQSTIIPPPTLSRENSYSSSYSSTSPSFRAHERSISASTLAPPSAARPPADLPPQPLPLPLSPGATSPPPLRRTSSTATLTSSTALMTTCKHTSDPRDEETEPKISNFPRRHLVSNLQHFARYSSAAYGQSFLRILGLAKSEVSASSSALSELD